MLEHLEEIRRAFEDALASASDDPKAVDEVRVRFLGRKGEFQALMKQLGAVSREERPVLGKEINRLKKSVESDLEEALTAAREAASHRRIAGEASDVSLPASEPWHGSLHPVTRTRRDLEAIFLDLGFTIEAGPEIEDDFHNFQSLNMPADHPARDATDTFYLDAGLLLRTHTSPVQIRTMLQTPPPIRMICPGRVFRRDLDATPPADVPSA